jgi:hypothetical protein
MAWKKPKWFQQVQKAADNVVKPITTSAPVKQIQAVAQKAINPITTSAPVKQVQAAAQNAANTVAKEVGHVVNPIAGEIALRAKNLANSEAVKKASDAVGDGLRDFDKNVVQPVATSNAMKAIQGKAQQGADYLNKEVSTVTKGISNTNLSQKSEGNSGVTGEFMPYVTKIIPNAVGDVVRGTGRTAAGILTADADKITSGAGMVGRGVWNPVKHGVMGALPFINSATQDTEGTMGGGRSGGAALREIPRPAEDTDDRIEGYTGPDESGIGVPQKPNETPIPPTPTSGSYLTGRQNKSRFASMKLPKKIRRR